LGRKNGRGRGFTQEEEDQRRGRGGIKGKGGSGISGDALMDWRRGNKGIGGRERASKGRHSGEGQSPF